MTSYLTLIETMRVYASILYLLRFIARFSSKVTNFNPPTLIPFEFRHDLWRQKTRVMGLSCGVVCVILRFSRFDTIPECDRQTHRQTHTHTHRHTTTAYTALSIASRGNKSLDFFLRQHFSPSSENLLFFSFTNVVRNLFSISERPTVRQSVKYDSVSV